MILVMAVACGVAVANIYFNQPLLAVLAAAFPGEGRMTALVPTITQLGYALGLVLLVPLGDRMDRRRVILLQAAALCLALVGVALAPSAIVLLAASALVGVTATLAQQIVPFAAEMASPEKRGAVIGTVMSGLLCGVLFGLFVAGTVSDHFGWRAVFGLGCLLMVLTAAALAAVLPRTRPQTDATYPALLGSLLRLWRDEPRLRRATQIQAAMFGSFSTFWTVLALHLDAQFHAGAETAGLFGVIGSVGILFAPVAGRVADKRGPYTVIGLGCVTMLFSWLVFAGWQAMAGLVVGVILIDFGQQGALISNQHVIYALRPEARSRINTIFMSGMFLGGAAGSVGAAFAWHTGGWLLVCAYGGMLATIALALTGLDHRRRSKQ